MRFLCNRSVYKSICIDIRITRSVVEDTPDTRRRWISALLILNFCLHLQKNTSCPSRTQESPGEVSGVGVKGEKEEMQQGGRKNHDNEDIDPTKGESKIKYLEGSASRGTFILEL